MCRADLSDVAAVATIAQATDVSPAEVARRALENLREGPVHLCSEPYKARFEQLTALPRRDALTAAAKAPKGS